jgi:LPXTG-motif cell wall-anchored protein
MWLMALVLKYPPNLAGDYLALRVFNSSSSTPYTVVTDGNSWLSSPATDPGYPLPEMSALILLGIGLAGLGGYILVRRKKEARGHIGQ